METHHWTQRDPQVWAQLKGIKQDNERKKIRFTKQKYYETGPKAMKLLSWRLSNKQTELLIK